MPSPPDELLDQLKKFENALRSLGWPRSDEHEAIVRETQKAIYNFAEAKRKLEYAEQEMAPWIVWEATAKTQVVSANTPAKKRAALKKYRKLRTKREMFARVMKSVKKVVKETEKKARAILQSTTFKQLAMSRSAPEEQNFAEGDRTRQKFEKTIPLSPSVERAWSQYNSALAENPDLEAATDREVYDWIKTDLLDKGEPLPSFDTWGRYIRKARSALLRQKHRPRSWLEGKSVVPREKID